MPKSRNQKLKILYLKNMLLDKTDEQHSLSVQDIINELSAYDIKVERKTVYSDIEALRQYGMDIINRRENPAGYYVASRQFELPELKLLVDAVQSSKFITEKKSRELIAKLETLASKNDAGQLKRQVVVADRIKTDNESIYYNIDEIHQAIIKNREILFQYFAWDVTGERVLKRDGAFYQVSPWLLTWDNENYYMIGFDGKEEAVKYFRVDKMLKISCTDKKRKGREEFGQFDIARFSKKTFSMFAGKEQTVVLAVAEQLCGIIYDRFGKEVRLHPCADGMYKFHTEVAVSRQFFGWLAGLGPQIRILSPETVREEYIQYLQEIQDRYKNQPDKQPV